jgi:hypothetical protein
MSHPTWRSWAPIRITIQTLVVRRARAFSKRHVRQKPLEVKIAPSRRSRPVAGGSTVGLSATDAWDKAAAGDAATMRLSGTDGELKPAIATIKCSQWKRFGGSQGAASLTRPSHWYREGRLSLVMSLPSGRRWSRRGGNCTAVISSASSELSNFPREDRRTVLKDLQPSAVVYRRGGGDECHQAAGPPRRRSVPDDDRRGTGQPPKL